MLIRDAQIDDYNQIHDLNLKHNLKTPHKKEWEKIWIKNPYFDLKEDKIGWVIEDKKKIKGFLGYIKKKYIDNDGNEYDGLVSHNWVVDNDCRNMSLVLLNRFFTELKFDFYINSTASFEVAKVWEAFGAKKISNNNIQSTLYIPINNEKVSERIFKNKFLKYLLSIFFKYFTKFKILSGKDNDQYKTHIVNKLDDEIVNFKVLDDEKHFIKEKINYDWYLEILSKDNNLDFLKIYKSNIFIGYCILITPKDSDFKKTYLADVRINKDCKLDKNFYEMIIKKIFIYSKNLNSDLIQIKYLDEKIFKILKQIIILNKNYDYCSFFYYSPDQNLISKLSKKKWIISMLSGDSFLV
jgi:hypothetical protein